MKYKLYVHLVKKKSKILKFKTNEGYRVGIII